jgi:hypothetical protein
MPGCVTPLDHERRQLLDPRKSSFFTQGVACHRIARRNRCWPGVGTNRFRRGRADTREIGMFGCLDAVDDGKVVATLLRAAEDWLRERKCQIIRTPFLLSLATEPGLLIEEQWQSPTTLLGNHAGHTQYI